MSYLHLFLLSIFLFGCGTKEEKKKVEEEPIKKYTKFNGNYQKSFNDLHDCHLEAARKHGVGPLESRTDTTLYADKLVKIPMELDIYKVDKLKHSMPFLVPEASTLLSSICINFRDSLTCKKMALYKPIITSMMRSSSDVKGLAKRNANASDSSAHCYGTTFDISWVRFEKVNVLEKRNLDDGKLKAILGQVLHDLQERELCYVKHEKKQACFHITVR